MKLKESTKKFIEENKSYYSSWIFDEPILISEKHHLKLQRLQKILFKLINEYVINFTKYENLLDIHVSKKTKEILNTLEGVDYKIGTYRTDFVYDTTYQPKLIEITCRFALNGFFLNSIYDDFSKNYYRKHQNKFSIIDCYTAFIEYIDTLISSKNIFILKGNDLKNESKLFKQIFVDTKKEVTEIYYEEIINNLDIMKNGFIISELTLNEIETLSLETIKKLSELTLINDFRTSLLIHDKQFFSVLGNIELKESCLLHDEIQFFEEFYIPTFNSSQRPDLWNIAKQNKNKWILKHRTLGKSKSVYAGITTSQEKWNDLFNTENKDNFVIQKWIPQQKFKGTIKGVNHLDYIAGTLLFFNDNYFGLGMFRTSSFPITNVKDDKKMTSLVVKNSFKDDKNTIIIDS